MEQWLAALEMASGTSLKNGSTPLKRRLSQTAPPHLLLLLSLRNENWRACAGSLTQNLRTLPAEEWLGCPPVVRHIAKTKNEQ